MRSWRGFMRRPLRPEARGLAGTGFPGRRRCRGHAGGPPERESHEPLDPRRVQRATRPALRQSDLVHHRAPSVAVRRRVPDRGSRGRPAATGIHRPPQLVAAWAVGASVRADGRQKVPRRSPAGAHRRSLGVEASGVGNKPEPVAAVRGANGGSRYAVPPRIVPERGQVSENVSKSSTRSAATFSTMTSGVEARE
jgi:hypothetical protein